MTEPTKEKHFNLTIEVTEKSENETEFAIKGNVPKGLLTGLIALLANSISVKTTTPEPAAANPNNTEAPNPAKRSKNMIYVVGDSHEHAFSENPLFTLHTIGAATAHNLKNTHSTTSSNLKLFNIVNLMDREKDTIILVFGEIDCRIHIYYQHKKQDKSCLLLIEETVSNYGEVMQELKDNGVKFVICGIPPAGWEPNLNHYPYYASPEQHAKIYELFNFTLKQYCKEKKYLYLDIYSQTVGEDGHILPWYAEDMVHLNLKAQPILIRLLKEQGIL